MHTKYILILYLIFIIKNSASDSASLVKFHIKTNQEQVHENFDSLTTDPIVKAHVKEIENDAPVEGPSAREAIEKEGVLSMSIKSQFFLK